MIYLLFVVGCKGFWEEPRLEGHIAFMMEVEGNHDIYIMEPNGDNVRRLTDHAAYDMEPALSPDGQKVVFVSDRDKNWDIYMVDVDGSNVTQLTFSSMANESFEEFSKALDWGTHWSPDGRWIAFQSQRDGNAEIYVMRSDGSNQKRLTFHPADDALPTWSPDGTQIGFMSARPSPVDIPVRNFDTYLLDTESGVVSRVTEYVGLDGPPVWSPDGDLIAIASEREGGQRIFIVDVSSGEWRLLTEAYDEGNEEFNGELDGEIREGSESWSPDGNWLVLTYGAKICTIHKEGHSLNCIEGISRAAQPDWGP